MCPKFRTGARGPLVQRLGHPLHRFANRQRPQMGVIFISFNENNIQISPKGEVVYILTK